MLDNTLFHLFWLAASLVLAIATIAAAHLLFRCDRPAGLVMLIGGWLSGLISPGSRVLWLFADRFGWTSMPSSGGQPFVIKLSQILGAASMLCQMVFLTGLIWFALRLRASREHLSHLQSIQRDWESREADAGPR